MGHGFRFLLCTLLLCVVGMGMLVAQNGVSLAERKAIAKQIKQDTLPYWVNRLPERINSPFSEYNPLLLSDSLFFFTSMRSEVDDDNELFFDTHWSSRIYQADYEDDNYLNIRALSSVINKGKYYHPNFCFNKARNHIVFSRCYRTVDEELVCDLYESHLKKGKWEKPVLLDNEINGKDFSSTQPFLAELADYAVLYFVSNRPGGQGDNDIWFSIYKNGKYEVPINAGSGINTPGNEVTPFYDTDSAVLYFSSDEWPGIGGYDIFSSKGALCSWTTPKNMGVPLNSEENDIYFSVNKDNTSGYFSSNRPVDDNHLEDTCCNDIYRWEAILPVKDIVIQQDTTLCAIKKIFPINLYFDNDQPDAKTTSDTTTINYMLSQSRYRQQKELYLAQCESAEAKQWMEVFFEDSLSSCRDKVMQLFAFLEERLAQGQRVVLSIEGYASFLHNSDYNRHLSQRRIVSLMNEMRAYKQGVLSTSIKNGQLVIKELPYGSSKAATLQGDAVYGRQAILQRKIIVWDVEIRR
ncbi:MAG: PD40 domain-containing protein [Bacteroidales bacterium]|nr:PD40 domain-containing protein [Bacteroidales bacterium]